jgi:membrane protease YdiL (CAAX protease family)
MQNTRTASFFVLACGITWALALPAVLAWLRHEEPPSWAIPLVGLSAFGPSIAAVIVASRRGEVRSVFRPWRTHPIWIVIALFLPMAIQVVARLIDFALGGQPSTWVNLPSAPEHVAALVVFSFGEEFGWRGFAQPRTVARYGPIAGALLVGSMWALWHLMYMVRPETGEIDVLNALVMVMLLPYSIIFLWLMQRAGGSIVVAIAFHAGGHLDNINRLPLDEVRVRVITFVLVVILAVIAARSLRRS